VDLFRPKLFEDNYDARRHAYARARLLNEAVQCEPVLDAVFKHLKVPHGGASLSKLDVPAKQAAIVKHAKHLSEMTTSRWHRTDVTEIVAASIAESKLAAQHKATVFPSARREAELTGPVVNWLRTKCDSVYEEVPMGTSRADVVGYRPPFSIFGAPLTVPTVVTVELKNQLGQLTRGLDQMTTYRDYSTSVYLACTPRLAVDYLKKHANSPGIRRWEPDALEHKLKSFGFGLLLIEGEEVTEVRPPKSRVVDSERFDRIRFHLDG